MDNQQTPAQPAQQPTSVQTVSSRPKKKILILEDDFFIRDLYEMQAKKAGYDVITASDGEEGIQKTKAEKPNLILIDLMLPKIDGISIIKAIKTDPTLANIPCILVTNLEDSAKEKEAAAAGAAAYLLKIKNTPTKVIEVIKQYIG